MIKKIYNTKQEVNSFQSGYTLVELMVGVVLGLLITAAVIQTYLSTKQTYRVTEGVSRVQENARFGLHFITEDLRNAGFSGCIGSVRNKLRGDPDEYISFDSAVIGWDYEDTKSNDSPFSLSEANATLSLPSAAGNWSRTTASGTADLPDTLVGEVVAGSDVVWFKNYEALDIVIKTHNDNASPITTESAHGIENNSILLVGNCSEVEMFQHLSQGSGNQVSLVANEGNNGDPGNRKTSAGLDNWGRKYTAADSIFGFVQTYYYIGEGASGLPSLFRYKTGRPESAITAADITSGSEELVEGIETMQLLYGEDIDGDETPNRYVSASQIGEWGDVVSVRIGLLVRSSENASDDDQATNYTLLDSIDFTHGTEDAILRYGVNSTVKLRNRGLDKNLAYYVCNAPSSQYPADGDDCS